MSLDESWTFGIFASFDLEVDKVASKNLTLIQVQTTPHQMQFFRSPWSISKPFSILSTRMPEKKKIACKGTWSSPRMAVRLPTSSWRQKKYWFSVSPLFFHFINLLQHLIFSSKRKKFLSLLGYQADLRLASKLSDSVTVDCVLAW